MLAERAERLPRGWSVSRIRELAVECNQRAGRGTDLPVLSVTKHRGIVRSDEFFSKRVYGKDTSNYKVVHAGQFAYATIHLNEGSIGKLRGPTPGIVSPMYTVFDVHDRVDRDYLFAVLKSELSLRVYGRITQGTVNRRGGISFKTLSELLLHHPPLPEQKKIAAILSSLDDAIEKTQAVIDQVQVVKRGLMQELLTRGLPGRHTRFKQTEIGEIPEEWGLKELGDVASVGNGTTPSKKREDYWQGGTIAWLPTGRVNDRVIRSANVYVTKEAVQQTSLRVLPVGTLLVAMIGQGKTRGKTAFLEIEACVNQNFAYVIPRNAISPKFLFCVLEHQYEALRSSGRGSNQGALNCQLIKRFKVPLPTTDEQCKITYGLSTLDTRLEVERLRVDCLGYVKAALVSVLLRGEIRVAPDHEAA